VTSSRPSSTSSGAIACTRLRPGAQLRSDGLNEKEEPTQDVFAAAAAALPEERPGDPPVLAWLYTVARRRFTDEPTRRADDYEPIAGALRDAIAALPGGQAQVVLLKLVHGRTFAEIGAEVGLTEAEAKMRFVRGLERLRAELSETGVEP
jgi:DNA-directed RNA polymerase specialized sigma24 family protein